MIIIGHSCVGKTHYGKQLRYLTGLPLFDSDEEIERYHSINQLFSMGEPTFRAVEKAVVGPLLIQSPRNAIIVLGAGAPVDEQIKELIISLQVTSAHKVLWLKAPADVVAQRITSSRKPKANVDFAQREKIYQRLADQTITIGA
jgi:shikimate kinase